MELRTYLSTAPRGTAAAIARAVGVSPVMVTQWANGEKEIPVRRCLAIEQACSGEVKRSDLRPNDYWEHWPDLPAPEVIPTDAKQAA